MVLTIYLKTKGGFCFQEDKEDIFYSNFNDILLTTKNPGDYV